MLYRQSAFDLGWALLTPAITLAGYGLVLTRAFGVTGDGIPYLSFAWTGVVVWTFVANGLSRGASSLLPAADLIRKVSFPKEVVPLASVTTAGLDLLIGLVALLVLMLIQGLHPSGTAIALLPIVAVMYVWTSAVAILLATVTAFVRDLVHALAVVLRIGIFVTPVMYPPSQVPERYHWALDSNPIAVFIEATRACLLRGRWPDWSLLGIHAAAAAILLVAAFGYLRRVEARIADVI